MLRCDSAGLTKKGNPSKCPSHRPEPVASCRPRFAIPRAHLQTLNVPRSLSTRDPHLQPRPTCASAPNALQNPPTDTSLSVARCHTAPAIKGTQIAIANMRTSWSQSSISPPMLGRYRLSCHARRPSALSCLDHQMPHLANGHGPAIRCRDRNKGAMSMAPQRCQNRRCPSSSRK